jgi:hypothetical protein
MEDRGHAAINCLYPKTPPSYPLRVYARRKLKMTSVTKAWFTPTFDSKDPVLSREDWHGWCLVRLKIDSSLSGCY